MDQGIEVSARHLLEICTAKGLRMTAAESCTGGLLMASLTDIPGASAVVEAGFVTYSNDSKRQLLGVALSFLEQEGAVSESVARAMAEGALAATGAQIAMAITGIAGPGSSAKKPEGLVHLACAAYGQKTRHECHEFGALGRVQVRILSVQQALKMLIKMAETC